MATFKERFNDWGICYIQDIHRQIIVKRGLPKVKEVVELIKKKDRYRTFAHRRKREFVACK